MLVWPKSTIADFGQGIAQYGYALLVGGLDDVLARRCLPALNDQRVAGKYRLHEAGCQGFMTKPISLNKFMSEVDKFLQKA